MRRLLIVPKPVTVPRFVTVELGAPLIVPAAIVSVVPFTTRTLPEPVPEPAGLATISVPLLMTIHREGVVGAGERQGIRPDLE